MKMKKYLFLVMTLLLVTSCSNEEVTPPNNGEKMEITATIDNAQTRISLEDQGTNGVKLTWEEGDKISFYNNDNWVADFTLKASSQGSATGKFEKTNGTDLVDGTTYTVNYPYTGATTTDTYKVYLSNQTQDMAASTLTSSSCFMQKTGYVYNSSNPAIIQFTHQYALMTMKIAAPDDYNAATDGRPNQVFLYNGNEVYRLALKNANWSNGITAHLIIDPIANTSSRPFIIEVTTGDVEMDAKAVFRMETTSTKAYKAGSRYTADCTTADKKLTRVAPTTFANVDSQPDNLINFVITDASIASDATKPLSNKLKKTERTVPTANLYLPNATQIPNHGLNASTYTGFSKLALVSMPLVSEAGLNLLYACSNLSIVYAPQITKMGDFPFNEIKNDKPGTYILGTETGAINVGIRFFENTKAENIDLILGKNVSEVNGNVWTANGTSVTFKSITRK